MELKVYLQILIKKWWIVIPAFLVTFTTGMILTYTQAPTYSATATYVIVPSSSFSDVRSFAGGLDQLGRREELALTFTEIAMSRNVRTLAVDSLGIESAQGYSVSSELRAGTNIIEIVAKGPDPVITRDFANSIGTALEEYVKGLYEVFILLPLDTATAPRNPSSPNIPLNLILAGVLGLALGGGLAALSEYLEKPIHSPVSVNIIDEQTGIYNKPYFLQRLSQEMIRAKRNRYPLSLSLIRVDNLNLLKGINSSQVRTEVLRQVALVVDQHLREEDIVAHFDNEIFAILLPDTTGENAKAIMEYIQTLIAWTPFHSSINNLKFNLNGTVGIVTYGYNGTSRDELMAKASQALELADVGHNGKTHLITELTTGEHYNE